MNSEIFVHAKEGEPVPEARLKVSMLGTWEMTLDGRRLGKLRTRKVQALLAYLLLQGLVDAGNRLDRERLIVLLWPEKSGKAGRENLRQALYHLRKSIPEVAGADGASVPLIQSNRQQVWLNPQARVELDVATFMALLDEGHPEALEAAVALYREDFLADLYLKDSSGFESWAAEWRALLRQQVMEAMETLVDWNLTHGHAEQAATYAQRQLALDDLREEAYRQLMVALGQMGKRSDAIRTYERCRTVLQQELGVAPTPDTEAVVQAIRTGTSKPTSTEGTGRSLMPVPDDPLIGRDEDVAQIVALLQGEARLVSIVGPGGSGKTRLALAVAQQFTADVHTRAVFVPLAMVTAPEEVAVAVARALAIEFEQEDRERVQQRLLDYLSDKQILLVLDNFEQLLPGASLLNSIVRMAPKVRLLVTSREVLQLQTEHIYPLAGLAFAEWTTPAAAVRDPAVQLFLHHARRVRNAFALRCDDLAPLHRILRLTEGMPLALVLAAGWVRVFSPAELAAELDQSLDLLSAAYRDMPPRQQSMRAVFDSTWARLGEREQSLFAALSIFRGGFTLAGARTVTGATPHELLSLADRSLVLRSEQERFDIHELLRQYAAEKLEQSGKTKAVAEAHSAYYMDMLAQRLPDLKGKAQLEALNAIATDFENIRIAWHWTWTNAHGEQTVAASQSLYLFALIRNRHLEGTELFTLADKARRATLNHREPVGPYVLAGRASLLARSHASQDALTLLPDLQHIVATHDTPEVTAYCRLAICQLLTVDGCYAEAVEVARRASTYYTHAQDSFYAALAVSWGAAPLQWAGHPRAALNWLQQALPLARQAGDPYSRSKLLTWIGALLWMSEEGASERSERYYWEGTVLQRELGEKVDYAMNLAQVANMPLWRDGDVAKAHPHLAKALAIAEEQNVPSVRLHILAEITTHRLVAGNYVAALALTEEILASSAIHAGTRCWASVQRGIALLGLDRIDDAVPWMKQGLTGMINLNWRGFLSSFLPFFGIILAQRGEHERAAALLGRGFAQAHAAGRLEIDPMINTFRATLRERLGEKRFAQAWEDGSRLDALTVAKELLAALDSDC